MATAAKAAATKTKRAGVLEAHFFWIDLSPFYGHQRYAIWKEVQAFGKKAKQQIICVGLLTEYDLPEMEPEFEFGLGDLGSAFEQLAGRKKQADLGDGEDSEYGAPVELGTSGLSLSRLDRYAYRVEAPCGEAAHFRAGELRGLVTAVEELQVSTIPA